MEVQPQDFDIGFRAKIHPTRSVLHLASQIDAIGRGMFL
jgi:hypothetical protein